MGTNTLRKAAVGSAIVGLYCLLPLWKENSTFHAIADHSPQVYAGPELLLGLLLVLRSNAAYQRWWEGRTLWGKLVNVSRNLAVKVDTLLDVGQAEKAKLKEHIQRFAAEFRDHLRANLAGQPTKPANSVHQPNQRVREIYALLNDWRLEGKLSDDLMRVLDSEVREFLEVCGGCERIQKTPLAKSYRLFLYQGIALLLFAMPWGLVNVLGAWAVPLTMIHAYILIGLQVLASTVEDPFGVDADDLDLDALAKTIASTLG